MTNMSSLSTELLDMIFACVVALGEYSWGAEPSRMLFPLNLAAVCSRWLDILKSHPQYWQRVVIDLADDPAPFLDTFTLFEDDDTNTPIDVLVFCSMPSVEKGLENLRSRVVFENLEPALKRCATVAFRLAYQSSLPSAADILVRNPQLSLTELHLTCSIYDRDEDELDLNMDDGASSGSVILPALSRLSLTGFHFLELCRAGRLVTIQGDLGLSINHFKFRKQSLTLNPVGSEGFAMLMNGLQDICENSYLHLALSDIALGYRPSTTLSSSCEMFVDHLSFDAVSPDFILAFFARVCLSETPHLISFRRSAIPPLSHFAGASAFSDHFLELVDIPHETPHIAQNTHDNSIRNAIEAFPPLRLRVLRCAGFDDSILDWFSDDRGECGTPQLTSITLHDCTAFTAAGLLGVLRARVRMHMCDYDIAPITTLEVGGRGPALSKGDAAWLLEDVNKGTDRTSRLTRWNVEGGDGVGPGVVTDFRSPGEENRLMWDRTTWGVFQVQL